MFLFWDYIVEASRGGGSLRLVSHDINTPSNRLYKALRSTAYGDEERNVFAALMGMRSSSVFVVIIICAR